MSSTLLSLLQSTDESEHDRSLSELILSDAAPLIRHTLRERLGFYINQSGVSPNNPEAEDLYQECLAKLIQRVNEQPLYPDKEAIRNFPHYVVRLATNACNDYLRRKSPARARLKNKLYDLLTRHPDFSIWRDQTGESLCGFTAWCDKEAFAASLSRLRQLEEGDGSFKESIFTDEDIHYAPLTKVVAEICKWVDSPIQLDQLVNVVAFLLEIKDYPVRSIETDDTHISEQLIDSSIRCDTRLEARETLQQLWEEIRGLSPKQRDTFCLSFADDNGDDLFSLLLAAEIISLPQLARELDLSLDRLMILWKEMPMDNATLSNELNASRSQINKWRFRALEKLRKRITPLKARG